LKFQIKKDPTGGKLIFKKLSKKYQKLTVFTEILTERESRRVVRHDACIFCFVQVLPCSMNTCVIPLSRINEGKNNNEH
jgi:hypothetical protein